MRRSAVSRAATCSTRCSAPTKDTQLWVVLAAPQRAGCARVPLPLHRARGPRLPGRPEELSRPLVSRQDARSLGREHAGVREHDRHARAALTPSACRRPTRCSPVASRTSISASATTSMPASTPSKRPATSPRSARRKSATSGRASRSSKPRWRICRTTKRTPRFATACAS